MGIISWLTGRSANHKVVAADPEMATDVAKKIGDIATIDVVAAKDDVSQKIRELNSAIAESGIEVPTDAYDGIFDNIATEIENISENFNKSIEDIEIYNNASDAERVLSSLSMASAKFGEGVLSLGEDFGDGVFSLVGWIAPKDSAVEKWCQSFVEKEWSHDAFNFYYNSEFAKKSAFTEDSAISGGFKLAGETTAFLWLGGAISGSASVASTSTASTPMGSIRRGFGKFFSSTTRADTYLAAQTGLGRGTEGGIRNGLDINTAARTKGLKTAAVDAALIFAAGKASEHIQKKSAIKTANEELEAAQKAANEASDAVTKATEKSNAADTAYEALDKELQRADDLVTKGQENLDEITKGFDEVKKQVQNSEDVLKNSDKAKEKIDYLDKWDEMQKKAGKQLEEAKTLKEGWQTKVNEAKELQTAAHDEVKAATEKAEKLSADLKEAEKNLEKVSTKKYQGFNDSITQKGYEFGKSTRKVARSGRKVVATKAAEKEAVQAVKDRAARIDSFDRKKANVTKGAKIKGYEMSRPKELIARDEAKEAAAKAVQKYDEAVGKNPVFREGRAIKETIASGRDSFTKSVKAAVNKNNKNVGAQASAAREQAVASAKNLKVVKAAGGIKNEGKILKDTLASSGDAISKMAQAKNPIAQEETMKAVKKVMDNAKNLKITKAAGSLKDGIKNLPGYIKEHPNNIITDGSAVGVAISKSKASTVVDGSSVLDGFGGTKVQSSSSIPDTVMDDGVAEEYVEVPEEEYGSNDEYYSDYSDDSYYYNDTGKKKNEVDNSEDLLNNLEENELAESESDDSLLEDEYDGIHDGELDTEITDTGDSTESTDTPEIVDDGESIEIADVEPAETTVEDTTVETTTDTTPSTPESQTTETPVTESYDDNYVEDSYSDNSYVENSYSEPVVNEDTNYVDETIDSSSNSTEAPVGMEDSTDENYDLMEDMVEEVMDDAGDEDTDIGSESTHTTIDTGTIDNTKKKKGNNVVPVIAGLGAATAAGVGAKMYMDNRENSDNDSFAGTESWDEDYGIESNLEENSNDNMETNENIENEENIDDQYVEPIKYNAKSIDELSEE